MKPFKRTSIRITIATLLVSITGALGLATPFASAASSPTLGTAAAYSVLAGSQITNVGASTISADVGISPGIGVAPHYTGFGTVTLTGTIHDADAEALTAQGDKNTAYSALTSQACTVDYGGITKELAGITLSPGVYCATSFHLSSGILTLDGTAADVWIFKSASDLIITGSSATVVFLGGGQPCNVWWSVASTATFDAGSAFVGNVLASTSITFAAGSSLDGRALAGTAEVTLDSASITGPTCVIAPGASSQTNDTITVIKEVVNDNDGTAVFTDFPLFINGSRVNSGQSVEFAQGSYTVSETNLSTYTATFSGDCDANGIVNHNGTRNDICIITNNDIGAPDVAPPIPPLIDIVKVPTPLALPDGSGLVTYDYTVRNIGTVPISDVTVVDDSCTPTTFIAGDTNADTNLDVTETWTYSCETTLSATHTNIVVATGWANGISAVDTAEATVVVGIPLVPPLIHVTKIPSPLALLEGSGSVTYSEDVSNPGTVPLHGVTLVDDKCSPMIYNGGDTNGSTTLDPTETWNYSCTTTLTETTTNTATATGAANGFVVKDLAVATVVVTAAAVIPTFPKTGTSPEIELVSIAIGSAGILLLGMALFCIRNRKHSLR